MPQSRKVSNLITIDENMTLSSIMGGNTGMQMDPQTMNIDPGELLKESLNAEQPKKRKRQAKNQAIPKIPAAPQMNPVAPPMNPVAPPNKTDNKEEIIMKILRYQNSKRFGDYINKTLKIKYSREQLSKISVDRLESILHRIRINLNNRNVDAMIDSMVQTCAVGYEHTISNFYDITGFTELLLNNPGFHDAVERYKCECQMPDIPPGLQIGYIVASTTLAAHSLNEMNKTAINKTNTTDLKTEIKSKGKQQQPDQPKSTNLSLGQKL